MPRTGEVAQSYFIISNDGDGDEQSDVHKPDKEDESEDESEVSDDVFTDFDTRRNIIPGLQMNRKSMQKLSF